MNSLRIDASPDGQAVPLSEEEALQEMMQANDDHPHQICRARRAQTRIPQAELAWRLAWLSAGRWLWRPSVLHCYHRMAGVNVLLFALAGRQGRRLGRYRAGHEKELLSGARPDRRRHHPWGCIDPLSDGVREQVAAPCAPIHQTRRMEDRRGSWPFRDDMLSWHGSIEIQNQAVFLLLP